MSILRHTETPDRSDLPDLSDVDFTTLDHDYGYKMTDAYGMVCTIYGDDDGEAYVEYWDDDMCQRRTLTFPRGEVQAWNWAWNHGYRE